ncbi:MAG: hypothetical protein JRI68_00315 [Deltaproteobacteria bacterium]|nr:hypothetical protein [Deltaproteobacteria bacterium]
MGEQSRAILALPAAALVGLAAACTSDGDDNGAARGDEGWAAPVALAQGLDRPTALGQDRFVLYVASEQGLVQLVPKDGSKQRTVAESFGLAADLVVEGDDIYWIDATWGRLWTLSMSTGEPSLLAIAQATPRRLAIDGTYLYRIDDDGQVIRTSRSDGFQETLSTGHQDLGGLCLDDERVYFTDRSAGLVLALPLFGGPVQYLAVTQDQPATIAVDDTRLYWTTATAVMSLAIDEPEADPEPEVVAAQLSAPNWLTAAGGHVYWSSAAAGTVSRAPKAGGDVDTIATNQSEPGALVVDAVAAYWITYGTASGKGALYQAEYRFATADD